MREWIVTTLGGGAAALAIIVAVIGLAGALGGAATSYLVAQKTVYINSITAERMKWINSLRNHIAELLSHLTIVRVKIASENAVPQEQVLTAFRRMSELGKVIELQMNIGGEIDRNILYIIQHLYSSTTKDRVALITPLSEALVEHSRWLLKLEWERVKYEARGPLGKAFSKKKMKGLLNEYGQFVSNNPPKDAVIGRQ